MEAAVFSHIWLLTSLENNSIASSIDLKKLFVKRVSTVIPIEQMMKWMSRQRKKRAQGDEQTASRGSRGLGSFRGSNPQDPATPHVKSLSRFTAARIVKFSIVMIPGIDSFPNNPWPDLHEVYFYSNPLSLLGFESSKPVVICICSHGQPQSSVTKHKIQNTNHASPWVL